MSALLVGFGVSGVLGRVPPQQRKLPELLSSLPDLRQLHPLRVLYPRLLLLELHLQLLSLPLRDLPEFCYLRILFLRPLPYQLYLFGLSLQLSGLQLHQLPQLPPGLLLILQQHLLSLSGQLHRLQQQRRLSAVPAGILPQHHNHARPVPALFKYGHHLLGVQQHWLPGLHRWVLLRCWTGLSALQSKRQRLRSLFFSPGLHPMFNGLPIGLALCLLLLLDDAGLPGLQQHHHLHSLRQWPLPLFWRVPVLRRWLFGMHR